MKLMKLMKFKSRKKIKTKLKKQKSSFISQQMIHY